MAGTRRQAKPSGRASDRSLAGSGAAVGASWLGMTLVQSRLLTVQLVALLVATGGIFTWYNKYFAAFYDQHPVLAPVIVGAIPLYILCFSVGPQMWQRRRRAQRDSIALAADLTPGRARHFRLDPYVPASPQQFHREDAAHDDVLKWIGDTSRPVLFLSGVSGAGKSSVLEGYVLPMLREQGWKVEQVRSFNDPLPQLETILAVPRRKGTRLLVVFDQFEEFAIVEDRASADARRRFVARLQEICRTPTPGLCLLLSFRRDYMSDVTSMQIDDVIAGRTFMEIEAFKHGAARRFLEAAPSAPSSVLVDRMLAGAEALDDVPARFRPVTLNMLGLALEEYDREMGGRPERLVQSYVEAAVAQPEIKEIAPRVIEKMITEANTKRSRTVLEIAAETGLGAQDVLACLVLLERRHLVRRLDTLWEISHDFVARQFALVLGRLRPNPWRKAGMFAAAALFVLVVVGAPIGMRLIVREQAFAALRSLKVSVTEDRNGALMARLPYDATEATINDALRPLGLVEINGLEISSTKAKNLPSLDSLTRLTTFTLVASQVTTLPSLDKLTALTTLELSGARVTTLPSLDMLTALTTLDLRESAVKTLPSLDKLTNLKSLNLSNTEVTTLPSLDNLTALTELNLDFTGLTTLPSLDRLTALKRLSLIASRVTTLPSLDKLTALTVLDLSKSMVTALPSLDGLSALTDLGLGRTQLTTLPSLDKLTALTTLDLRDLRVTTLPSLDKLTSLRRLELGGSQVTSLPSLDKLTALTSLDLSNTALLTTLPSLDELTALTSLDLSNSGVTKLPSLDKLTALTSLDLHNTEMTTLPSLDKLTALTTLDLSNSRVTKLPSLDKLTSLDTLHLRGRPDLVADPSLRTLVAAHRLHVWGD